jgi:hypothetical protein
MDGGMNWQNHGGQNHKTQTRGRLDKARISRMARMGKKRRNLESKEQEFSIREIWEIRGSISSVAACRAGSMPFSRWRRLQSRQRFDFALDGLSLFGCIQLQPTSD